MQYQLLLTLVMSLHRVDTRLPVYCILVGRQVPAYEDRLTRLGVRLVRHDGFDVPGWASGQHAASFHKLALLELPLEKVIYLDADCQARAAHVTGWGSPLSTPTCARPTGGAQH